MGPFWAILGDLLSDIVAHKGPLCVSPFLLMSSPSLPSGKHFDVIIVGAGVSGLQCATSLRDDHGITNVLILEAADYVGGFVLFLLSCIVVSVVVEARSMGRPACASLGLAG